MMWGADFLVGFWENFHFLRPVWLFAALPAFFTAWGVNRVSVAPAHWQRFIAPHLIPHLLVGEEGRRFFRPANMLVLVSVISAIAMAGPTWQRKISPLAEDSASLALLLDLSATMEQADVAPSRLERAKLKIRDLLAERPAGRTALIVYAGTAHTVIPLTNDPQVVENMVGAVKADMMPAPGKNLSAALALAEDLLADSFVPGSILIMSDGLGTLSPDLFEERCSASRHGFLVQGFGLPDSSSAQIAPDWDSLRALAQVCGGVFEGMTHDDADVQALVNRINLNFVSSSDEDAEWIDFGYYLLYPILLLMLLWFRPGWTLKFAMVPFMVLQLKPAEARDWTFMDLWMTPDQQGQHYFDQGDYLTAAERFEDPLWKATAFYMAEDFKTAADLFGLSNDAAGYFRLGNALAHDRHYLAAVKAYDRCLKLQPDFPGVQDNRDRLRAIMDEINAVSAAQADEDGDDKMEAGDDVARTAEGADRETSGEFEREEYSADDLLGDPAIHDLWMKRVQPDPANFLRLKFRLQYERETGEGS